MFTFHLSSPFTTLSRLPLYPTIMTLPHTLFPSRATRPGPKSTATTSRSLCQVCENQAARINKNLTSRRVVCEFQR